MHDVTNNILIFNEIVFYPINQNEYVYYRMNNKINCIKYQTFLVTELEQYPPHIKKSDKSIDGF